MNRVSQLEVFSGVPPEKESLAQHFKGMALAALTEAPDDPATHELVFDYLARAARALGKNCVVALAQGAAGATGVRLIENTYEGSLGQEIKTTEVVAHAAPVIEPGREDRSHQVVFAKGLHSPAAREAIDAHARHLAREQGYGKQEMIEYNPGASGLVQRAVNAVAGKPIFGTQSVTTDQAEFRQAAESLAAGIRYEEGQQLVERVIPAPVDRGLVQAEISAMHQAAAAEYERCAAEVDEKFGPNGIYNDMCELDVLAAQNAAWK